MKKDGHTYTTKKTLTRAIHVETVRDQADAVTTTLKQILKGEDFKAVYGNPVRFLPLCDQGKPTHYNAKIKRIIT